VHDNNYLDGPGIAVSLLAQGNGILVAGAVRGTITKNLVYSHDRLGIALVPYPEEDANALAPPKADWDTPCEQTHDQAVPPIDPAACKEVAGLLKACAVIWNPIENEVTNNEVSDSGVADLGVGTIDPFGTGETTDTLDNCFAGNQFSTTAPASLETLAPCGSTGSGDWSASALDLAGIFLNTPDEPTADAYKTTPEPAAQETMPDARTKPAERFTGPVLPNIDAIVVPTRPAT
jgi:hypothetical protein